MSVPFIDLKRFENGFLDAWHQKIAEITRETRFVGGADVAEFEANLTSLTGAKYAIGCANGTDAIQLALRGAGVGRGDTVLLPDSTFWATFEAVVNVGADPVTVDINFDDLQLDYDSFVQAVKKHKPKAAILVHLYGWASSRLADFRNYCREHSILLIEDGAQAFGLEVNGDSVYKDAHVSTISFYPAKVLGAAGDAGAVLTSDDRTAANIRSLGNHGRSEHYSHGLVGWNSRLAGIQAAYLNLSLKYFNDRIASRRKIARRYRTALNDLGMRVVYPPDGHKENGYLNVTLHDPIIRDKLKDFLTSKGIGTGIVYPGAVHLQEGAKAFLPAVGEGGGENAVKLSQSVLNLPLFPYMTDNEFDEVIRALGEFSV